MSDSINDVLIDTAPEPKVVDLDESFEAPAGGAWPKGWYSATILEGYSTPKGTVFTTSDNTSKDGASRNLKLCFKVSKGTQSRNLQENFNYRVSDFEPERIAHIKAMREEFKDVQGQWPDRDAQRSSLSLVHFRNFKSVLGHGVQLNGGGGVDPSQFIGVTCEVYLGIDENNYNKVKNVRPIKS
jgi:hypothetical protein